MPVPAGIRRPIITFSFRPRSLSICPFEAALIKTFVVYWKDADESQDEVVRATSEIPSIMLEPFASTPPTSFTLIFSNLKSPFSTTSP